MTLEAPTPSTDTGTYRCVASSPLGSAQLVFPVQVEPKVVAAAPKQPKFLTKPGPKIVKPLGVPIHMEASFEGVPTPVISWHKDGK